MIHEMLRKYFSLAVRFWLFILSALIVLAVAILSVIYLAAYFRGDTTVEASGCADIGFRVFYIENNLHVGNPVSSELHLFMSFTDFIEIDSGFSFHLSERADIYYSYTATERLVVRYMATVDGNINPIMYEESQKLSEVRGRVSGDFLRIPGGTYTVRPRALVYRYLEIVEYKFQTIEEQRIRALGFRGLSAELFIDFNYTVSVPAFGISRSLSRGYRMSLSTEVYSMVATGTPSFSESTNIVVRALPFELTMPVVIAFVVALLLSAYCFFTGVKRLQTDPNEHRQAVNAILKKYANEIVIYDRPINQERYEYMAVKEFSELLKLAINLNKHVMCYRDKNFTEFAVIVGDFACMYEVDY